MEIEHVELRDWVVYAEQTAIASALLGSFKPVATLPEKTRPKAKNLPLSEAGIIFET
ncbi:hypothetical protein GCM10017674_82100 [Streptomyces gardneri]|nr:hypothetical protein GCM10017674_82100 [Streptomyces gardneri]